MDALSFSTLVFVCVFFSAIIYRILQIGRREGFLPPGPPTTPILGNLLLLPKQNAYVKFTEWARQYGSVFSLKVSSGTVVVLSSMEAVYEIMEKNGSITSDRPNRAHLIRIFGEGGVMTQIQYGPTYRTWRRAANEMFKPSACTQNIPIVQAEVNQLMADMLDHPERFYEDIKRTAMSISFSLIFGIRTPSLASPECQKFLQAFGGMMKLGTTGEVPPVDLLPILYYLPDKFANHWKAKCDELRDIFDTFFSGLVIKAEKRVNAGFNNGCFVEKLMERAEAFNMDRKTISNLAGNFLGAGSHTTISSIHWTILLATAFQDAQLKAREEIDLVVGPDRAPTAEDLPRLPYLRAFIQEVLRFSSVAPLGVPHRTAEDLHYKGYVIPKGSTILTNTWAIFHDPQIFENPHTFNPDRFLKPSLRKGEMWKKLDTLAFGVGRRICPGMHLATQVLEMTAASMLWAFEFKSHPDGKPDVSNFISNSSLDPRPFKCDIKPRSQMKVEMIRHNLELSQSEFEKFEARPDMNNFIARGYHDTVSNSM
ncbi:hypothetical protein FRC03_004745 [Tulasnella sp. 419]|nr:hypothetical protein FRC02_012258 [Tulasnella sp. 418]KAG8941200.1 hypothetical protein FRC03_004745 [Tulasnella sp. 419]